MANRTFAIEKVGKWSLAGLRVAGLCLAGYLLFSLSAHSLSALWDVASIIIVGGPIFLICSSSMALRRRCSTHPALGTPLGLLGVSLGLVFMFHT